MAQHPSTALLVMDMQNDFNDESGLARMDAGKAILPNVIQALEIAKKRGILVVQWYSARKVGPAVKGSRGAELADGLVIKEGDHKLVKTRFSAFFATHLHSFLQGAGVDSLVITGVQTPNCIWQTAFDAGALDYQSVTVIVDATAAATPDVHAVLCYFQAQNFEICVHTPTRDNNTGIAKFHSSLTWTCKFPVPANIFDMKNVGIATPTLQEWSEADT